MKIFTYKYHLWRLLLLLLPVCVYGQYTGGTQDGCSITTRTNQNPGPAIYYGGVNDGVSTAGVAQQNPVPNIYYGGTNDGVSTAGITQQNPVPNIYYGGTNDGVSTAGIAQQNPIDTIYRGGTQDGVSSYLKTAQNATPSIYLGGTQDGVSLSSYINKNPSPSIYLGGADDGYSVYISPAQNQFSLMVKFKGQWSGSDALLDWEASLPKGIDAFELERSADNGLTFTKIAAMAVNSKIAGKSTYSHNDVAAYNLAANNVIYRLKAIAADGSPAYAALVRLDKDKSIPIMLVYPNPNTGRFTLGLSNTNNYNGFIYLVTDAGGKALQKGNITSASTMFNLSGNAAGTYYLSVFKNEKLLQHFTIVIAH